METLQINRWGGQNSHLLSIPGKEINSDNFELAIAISQVMEDFFRSNYWGHGIGGLSACQIAQNRDEALSLILLNEYGSIRILANPQIAEQSSLKVIARIGCFSAANDEKALQAVPQWMQIQYLDLQTKSTESIRLNYPVTNVAWHEMGHLRGASYEEDVLPGTRTATLDDFEQLNAHTAEEQFKVLLGNHLLSKIYNGSEIIYSSKMVEQFILDGIELTISR